MSDGIRVLLVDDSRVHRRALSGYIEASPALILCGSAADGAEAVDKVRALKPDIVLMDVQMPIMDGLAATREIMSELPTPILLMTAADNYAREVDLGLRALSFGALDLIPKPDFASLTGDKGDALASRLQLLAGVPVIHHPRGGGSSRPRPIRDSSSANRSHSTGYFRRARRVVGIVASTGGPRALSQIFAALPADLPAAVVVVQHIAQGFEEGLARWLNENSPLQVSLGGDSSPLMTGQGLVAPQGFQCSFDDQRKLRLVTPSEILPGHHYPSGDHLLASLAASHGRNAVGVVLTGIGSDGATGLSAIREAGGGTLAQDEETSVVYGMPKEAANSGAAQRVLPISEIAAAIVRLVE
ncbi:MAG: chemotaxis-specific protein-glutamate methyltransferase CheB [Planctomycetes bacterium]|nr:chemotaxis-specific protein-glutamate methyltransferase CheB [Planctomycetota bacterium]